MNEIEGTAQQPVYDIKTVRTLLEIVNKHGGNRDDSYNILSSRVSDTIRDFSSSNNLDIQGFRRLKFAYALVLLAYERGTEHLIPLSELMNRNPDKLFQAAKKNLPPEAQVILSDLDSCESTIQSQLESSRFKKQWLCNLDRSIGLNGYESIYRETMRFFNYIKENNITGKNIYKYLHSRIKASLHRKVSSHEFRLSKMTCILVLVSHELGSRKFKQYVKILDEDSKAFLAKAKDELSLPARRLIERIEDIEYKLDLQIVYMKVRNLKNEISEKALRDQQIYKFLEDQLRIELSHELNKKELIILKIAFTLLLISHEFELQDVLTFAKLLKKRPKTFIKLASKKLSPRAQEILSRFDDLTRVPDLEKRLNEVIPVITEQPLPAHRAERTIHETPLIAYAKRLTQNSTLYGLNPRDKLLKIEEHLRLQYDNNLTNRKYALEVFRAAAQILNIPLKEVRN